MERIAGLPFWEIRFDRDGDADRDGERAITAELARERVTDLLVFSHGWNNDRAMARRLYERFFALAPPLLQGRLGHRRRVGLLGVYWPSFRWPDEPIPDFAPGALPDLAGGAAGAASLARPLEHPPPPPPDRHTGDLLSLAFPAATVADVDELVGLLATRPGDSASLRRAFTLIAALAGSSAAAAGPRDGEGAGAVPAAAEPGRDGLEVFASFQQALEDSGVTIRAAGGAAGLGDVARWLWHGAQEVARQVTYWEMKQRAGKVGERGLGPFLARLHAAAPDLGVNLVGHSFGARLVAYALTALPAGGGTGVRSVTLLQGAFSHFTFADRLPFDRSRGGALKGMQARVAGPVIACYSRYDSAVGTFYPLASLPAGHDASALSDRLFRWGGIGYDGHQPESQAVELAAAGDAYDFSGVTLGSIDARRVVRHGRPPAGAHCDIYHPELAWVALCAAGVLRSGQMG